MRPLPLHRDREGGMFNWNCLSKGSSTVETNGEGSGGKFRLMCPEKGYIQEKTHARHGNGFLLPVPQANRNNSHAVPSRAPHPGKQKQVAGATRVFYDLRSCERGQE